jgi:hypothetical protein
MNLNLKIQFFLSHPLFFFFFFSPHQFFPSKKISRRSPDGADGKGEALFPEAGTFVPGSVVAAPENEHSRRRDAAAAAGPRRAAKRARRVESYQDWCARMIGPLDGDVSGSDADDDDDDNNSDVPDAAADAGLDPDAPTPTPSITGVPTTAGLARRTIRDRKQAAATAAAAAAAALEAPDAPDADDAAAIDAVAEFDP